MDKGELFNIGKTVNIKDRQQTIFYLVTDQNGRERANCLVVEDEIFNGLLVIGGKDVPKQDAFFFCTLFKSGSEAGIWRQERDVLIGQIRKGYAAAGRKRMLAAATESDRIREQRIYGETRLFIRGQ